MHYFETDDAAELKQFHENNILALQHRNTGWQHCPKLIVAFINISCFYTKYYNSINQYHKLFYC